MKYVFVFWVPSLKMDKIDVKITSIFWRKHAHRFWSVAVNICKKVFLNTYLNVEFWCSILQDLNGLLNSEQKKVTSHPPYSHGGYPIIVSFGRNYLKFMVIWIAFFSHKCEICTVFTFWRYFGANVWSCVSAMVPWVLVH